MPTLTIRNIDDGLKSRLRVRAAHHGHSMEEEARQILRAAMRGSPQSLNLADAIRRRFADLGGVDLPDLPRGPIRDIPDFD